MQGLNSASKGDFEVKKAKLRFGNRTLEVTGLWSSWMELAARANPKIFLDKYF